MLAELFWRNAGPNEFWVTVLWLLKTAACPVEAEFCMPAWFTVLELLSEMEDVPCWVFALLKKPSWLVDEVLFVKPFWVVLALLTTPTCVVVDELPA